MNKFEFRNIINSSKKQLRRKDFFKSLISSVDAGANGTLDYIIKKGPSKNKKASSKI